MKHRSSSGGLVYSTELGRTCPGCRKAIDACVCTRNAALPPTDGVVRVSRETKGRGGKAVTLVRGLPLGEAELTALGKQLKAACGSGGTTKDGVIEVQGDHRDKLIALLRAQGRTVKQAGG